MLVQPAGPLVDLEHMELNRKASSLTRPMLSTPKNLGGESFTPTRGFDGDAAEVGPTFNGLTIGVDELLDETSGNRHVALDRNHSHRAGLVQPAEHCLDTSLVCSRGDRLTSTPSTRSDPQTRQIPCCFRPSELEVDHAG